MSEETTRLENYCDAVFAFSLTLLILELKTPAAETIHNSDDLWHSLKDLLPSVFAFLLSFTIIATQWVNHHEAMKCVNKSTPRFIYANVFMLLTIIMIPLNHFWLNLASQKLLLRQLFFIPSLSCFAMLVGIL
jgi:uncharacterized membrane protein